MTVGAIIQARMSSSRLPGKVMMNIDGENPILYYVISQLRHSKLLDKIVIATTDHNEDEQIVKYVNELGVDYFRGSLTDVLDRYYQCAKKFSFSTIVRVTSDNPFVDPTIVDRAIEKFNSKKFDIVSNSSLAGKRTFPYGTDVEVFSMESLEKTWQNARKPSEREHVTPYIYNNKEIFRIGNLTHEKDLSHLRWTVDRKSDIEFVRTVISKIKKRPILLNDIISLLLKEPELIEINKKFIIDEGYHKSLKIDKELGF